MDRYPFRVMIIRDAFSKKEVYGQIIHDDYLADELDPIVTTDSVVRTYMKEFCSDCYVRNNKLDQGPLSDDFEGIVAIIAEESGMKEYLVVVKILYRPVDRVKITKYHEKSFNEWNAALEVYRGNPDPRVLEGPDLVELQREVSWGVFTHTFGLATLAIILSLVLGSLIDKNRP